MPSKPNIVIMLADDLGYGDVGFHGSDIQTPNLNRLAREGVSLEQFYVATVCSPTRAGLMTGRYPIRYGLMRAVIPPQQNFGLDTSEDIIPQMLERAGYEHRACIGKWHLGHHQKKWYPTNREFTHYIGCLNGAIDYFTHEREGELDFHKNGEPYRVEGYSTDIIADESVNFIDSVPKDEPYFLYVPFTAPHYPFQAKEEDIAKYPNREGKRQIYAGMVDSMDQGIGRILDAIDRRGDADNTFVLFFSDNGGVNGAADNGPQRGYKTTPYQGGIRVAAVARWTAGGIAGGQEVDSRMGYVDMFPTLKDIVGSTEEPKKPFDGRSALAAMRDGEALPDRPWFTYIDYEESHRERLAVNRDTYKLVVHRPAPDADPNLPTEIELFEIRKDSEEAIDCSAAEDRITKELMQEIDNFLKLKSKNQIPRFYVGRDGFQAPKDWQVDD